MRGIVFRPHGISQLAFRPPPEAGDRTRARHPRAFCSAGKEAPGPSARAFAEFAESGFPARVHAAMIRALMRDRVVEHISRDSTAIEARERPER